MPLSRSQLRVCAILLAVGQALIVFWQVSRTPASMTSDSSATGESSVLQEPAANLFASPNGRRSDSKNLLQDRTLCASDFREMSSRFQQTRVQCSSLFAGDRSSVRRAVGISKVLARLEEVKHGNSDSIARMVVNNQLPYAHEKLAREVKSWPPWEFEKLTNQWYLTATADCEMFRWTRGYITSPLTSEEEEFPIAFSIVAYKDIEMVERLLRSVYRPQNHYCIHVDRKADEEFYAAVDAVAGCFPENVRLSSERVVVEWGTYTILEPELICMRDLWDSNQEDASGDVSEHGMPPRSSKRYGTSSASRGAGPRAAAAAAAADATKMKSRTKKRKWKYFINLTGQEFPLKTNYELVQILKAFRGANNEEGTLESAEKERWKTKPPHGIKAIKGAVHTVLNRATVGFILNDPIALDFLEWLRGTDIPDETLFASINYNPQLRIPGTYNGSTMESVLALARFKKWNWNSDYSDCSSQLVVNDVCILSTADLTDLGRSPHLFANKFHLDKDRIVVGCLEERLFNSTRDEYLGTKTFNSTFYAQQDFVLNQVPGA